jgi:hypothetical protein
MADDLQTLAARLRVLEDERAILATMYQYGHSLDYGPRDEFLDCFTEDGIWDSRGRDAQRPIIGHYAGQEQLGSFYDNHTHAPALYHKHLLIEPRITIEGDTARVESYWARVDEHADGPYLRGFGRYRDVLVRCPDGRWRIRERRVELEASLRKS